MKKNRKTNKRSKREKRGKKNKNKLIFDQENNNYFAFLRLFMRHVHGKKCLEEKKKNSLNESHEHVDFLF